mgnify:CR=1 FL=1
MKTKITLLAFTCLLLTSCIKDYINNHHNNEDDVEFTETNFAYEPQLYEQYLNRELVISTERRDILLDRLDTDAQMESDLEELNELGNKIEYLNSERIGAMTSIEELVFAKPIPCPDETVAFDLCYPELDKLGFSLNVEVLGYLILDDNQEEVYNFEDGESLNIPGLENFATYQSIDLEGYEGRLNFVITRKDLSGEEITYPASANR